jgi:hypothetical protein
VATVVDGSYLTLVKRQLGTITALLEMASVVQEAKVWVEGEGDHALVCVRVLRSRDVHRFPLKDLVSMAVRKDIARTALENPVKPPRRRRLVNRGLLR